MTPFLKKIAIGAVIVGIAYFASIYSGLLEKVPGFSCDGFYCGLAQGLQYLFIGFVVIPLVFGVIGLVFAPEKRIANGFASLGIALGVMLICFCLLRVYGMLRAPYAAQQEAQIQEEFNKSVSESKNAVAAQKAAEALHTSKNASNDLAGVNQGTEGVFLTLSDVPPGTALIVVSRATASAGPWQNAFQVGYSGDAQPLMDRVDGTAADLFYKIEVRDASGKILKTYDTLPVPRYGKS